MRCADRQGRFSRLRSKALVIESTCPEQSLLIGLWWAMISGVHPPGKIPGSLGLSEVSLTPTAQDR